MTVFNPFDRITAFVLTFRDAGVEEVAALEKLGEAAAEALYPLADGVVVIATCNRFEAYMDGVRSVEAVRRRLRNILGPVAEKFKVMHGVEAVHHLLRVASGLDSLIPGDNEVLGQVRRAWLWAREKGFSSRLLDAIFHHAIVTGKRVRSETEISRGNVGYPGAAVRLASERLGGFNGKRVAVVGAGEASKIIASLVCGKWSPSLLLVLNRSVEKARELARKVCPQAEAAGLEAIQSLREVDVAFIAVSGSNIFISMLPSVARLVVDISIPAAVSGPNVVNHVVVAEYARRMIESRRQEIRKAERIVEEELEKLKRRLLAREADRAVAALMRYADTIIREEVEEAIAALGGDGIRETVEVAMHSLVKKLLHPLIALLRSEAGRGNLELVDLVFQAYSRPPRNPRR